MDIRLQEEQARLCHLAHGCGELARPLAQAPQTLFDRGELLQDVGCVHGLVSEVVGDAVQGVRGLVLLVAPLVELAVEAVSTGEVILVGGGEDSRLGSVPRVLQLQEAYSACVASLRCHV